RDSRLPRTARARGPGAWPGSLPRRATGSSRLPAGPSRAARPARAVQQPAGQCVACRTFTHGCGAVNSSQLSSTGYGTWTYSIAVAGTARTPVPYETVDGEPVRLFFLLAGPESQAGAHVKALSRISRLVRREPIRARLLAASDAEEFYRILVEAEGGGGSA